MQRSLAACRSVSISHVIVERVIALNQDRRRPLWYVSEANRRNSQRQLCGQPLAPLQPMFSHGLTNRRLNLALSGDASLFGTTFGCSC